jgi:gliding motility-associated-like protein
MKRIRSPILLLLFLLLSVWVKAQYLGSDGAGSYSVMLSQASCSAVVYPAIFNGGDENSTASLLVQQATCTPAVLPSLFTGGDENAASSALVSQVSCNAIVYPSIFAGGNEASENAIDIAQVSCAAAVLPNIFSGGTEDGFTGTAALQVACVTPPDPGIYAGGNSNVSTGVTFLTACAPYADFEADTQFVCVGDTVFFTDLSLGNPITWNWSFEGGTPLGSSQQNPFVIYNTAGTYQVQLQITAATGNSTELKTGYIVVGARPAATLTASGPTSFCEGDSVQLSVNPACSSYQWNTGQITQSVYFGQSGNYYSVVTAANGCTSNTDTISVVVLPAPVPVITANGPTTLCNADTLTLTSSPAASYLWLPGSETIQVLDVTTSGTYYVSVTYANGCSNVSAALNAVFGTTPATPVITPSGPLSFCAGDSVVLTSSPASSYLWSPGAASSQSITVKTPGTYYVETGNGSGCTAVSIPITVNVLANTPVPVITASGALSFCSGDSVVLTSSPAAAYNWSPGGQTTQSITVHSSGTYFVEADNGNNCPSVSTPVSVTVNTVPATPAISASGPITFCNGGNVTLTSTAATSYHWYPNGETTQSITVSATGNYYVETGNGTGCTASATPVSVTVNAVPATPTISASGPITFCNGGSVTLTSTAATSYYWYPNGETTQSITVSATGNYYVETGNGTGCTASATPVSVTVNAVPATPAISASGPLTFCNGGSVTLTSTAATSYHWYPNGETTQSITVSATGNYYVETGNGTGCTASATPVSVTVNAVPATPTISASGPLTFCNGGNVILTSTAATSYHWYPNGETTQSITVSATGNYYVETGNGTGCTASATPVNVTVNAVPATPTISASGPLTFCNGDSVVLTSSAAGFYQWYPGGETTQSITVSTSGNYYVETGNGSCTAQSSVVAVSVLARPAVPVISASGSLVFCEGDSVVLTSSLADSYLWNPSGNTGQSLTVIATGTYFVEVFNSAGCSNTSASVTVTVNPNPAINLTGPTVACVNTSESFTTTNLSGMSYLWTVANATLTSGSGTNTIDVLFPDTGLASVEVIVSDLSTTCFSQAEQTVIVLEAPQAYAGADVSVCAGQSVQLHAFGGTGYQWSPPLNLSNPTIADPIATPSVTTEYVVQVANGSCTDYDTVKVTVNAYPLVDAGPDLYITDDTCAVLAGSGIGTVLWAPAATLDNASSLTPMACPDTTTMYFLMVTGAGGCAAIDSMTVFVSATSDELDFPNTFTPNSDGTNDIWYISGLEQYPDHRLTVFNRWGNQVFDAQPYENNWDGTSLGRELPDGTYFYVFDKGNGEELLKGYLMIIR